MAVLDRIPAPPATSAAATRVGRGAAGEVAAMARSQNGGSSIRPDGGSNPTASAPSLAAVIDVTLPHPRNQLATKEHPEFLRLRRELYQYLGHH